MVNNRYAKYTKECDLYNYRMAHAVQSHTTNTAYLVYRDICIEEGIDPISRIDYQRYFDKYNDMIIDRLINKGMEWEIPHNLGIIKVVACERTRSSRYVNWGEYRKTGKYTVYSSTGTNKYVYKFKWLKTKYTDPDVKKYNLIINQRVRKMLRDAILNGSVYELDT